MNAASSAVVTPRLAELPKSSEIITIGPNSPATPAPITSVPNGVASSPRSRSTGSSVPMAVVLRATPTNLAETMNPAACSPAAMPIAMPSDSSQPATPSVSGRPRTRTKSSSRPAMKNSIARPNEARNTTSEFSVAQSSP